MLNKKGQVKVLIIVALVLVAIFFIVVMWQVNRSSVTGGVIGINEQNCREVETPYEEQEEYLKTEYYTETVPYEDNIPLEYESSRGKDWGYQCALWNYKLCYKVDITNIDAVGGIFEVTCNFRTLKKEFNDIVSGYVKPGDIESLECVADISMGEDIEATFTVNPPTKTVTKYKEVQRERQVTAYRPVTKYKTETVCD